MDGVVLLWGRWTGEALGAEKAKKDLFFCEIRTKNTFCCLGGAENVTTG